MYWPNEPAHVHPNEQIAGRAAFGAMAADGTISALRIYSYRVERSKFESAAAFEAAALEAVRSFAPDILFVQHLFGTDLSGDLWKRLRRELPGVMLVYHEGDPFDRKVKRLDSATTAILAHAHLVFACGLGSLADILAEHTRAPVRHLPHCFVSELFGRADPRAIAKSSDIVMIGNCGRRRRMKWSFVPGGRNRARLAACLARAFGERFALYGSGWAHLGPSSLGSLPFLQQERAIQSARLSVNWDHFDTIAYYFSDRLPISLAAGVPHVTTWHPGYDHFFAGVPGLYPCRTVEEAVETCRWLLGRSDAELLEQGLRARRWAAAHMESVGTFRRALDQAVALRDRRAAA